MEMMAVGRGGCRRPRDENYQKADASEDITMGGDASWKGLRCRGWERQGH